MYHNYNPQDLTNLKGLLRNSVLELLRNDKEIINNYQINSTWYGRKLHEVCINHRFALYLEKYANNFGLNDYFFDLEFNKKGNERKYSQAVDTETGKSERRPDIIVHRRDVSPENINNYLIIEAKKMKIIAKDERTIKSLMIDPDYKYKFGLSIIYSQTPNKVLMKIYMNINGEIEEENFEVENE